MKGLAAGKLKRHDSKYTENYTFLSVVSIIQEIV